MGSLVPGAGMVCGNPGREGDPKRDVARLRGFPSAMFCTWELAPKWIGGRYGVVGYEALYRTEGAL